MSESEFSLLKPALIFTGAGVGGLLRHWLGGIVQSWCGPHFPFGTLVVNITGCFAMGFLATALNTPIPFREEYRIAILVGVLGGFTTFSSFERETFTLLYNGEWWRAATYLLASNVFGLLAVWLGATLSTRLFGSPAS